MKLYVEKDTGYVDNSENKIEQQFQWESDSKYQTKNFGIKLIEI